MNGTIQKKTRQKSAHLGMRAGGPCATGRCEPCQAGNRAALSRLLCAMQSVCLSAYPSTRFHFRMVLSCFFMLNFSGALLMRAACAMEGENKVYQVLYRKWRPQVFEDVVGQPQVTVTLRNELKAGRIAHAYLFTGSRGTGKTTCAKILAKAVNCLELQEGDPCGKCEICSGIDNGSVMDVVEIDAASNNGVDNIRDLREEANFTPASAKYRVYIIDEVHMLSVGAFNALLKTLEEPPAHVIFILATTEVHKLPSTILSRCQRFDFHRIAPEEIAARLEYICGQEGMRLEHEAALLIARLADGGLRDALSLLDQCMGLSGQITEEIVTQAAGLAGKEHLFALASAFSSQDCGRALKIINELHTSSKDMARLCEELISHFRSLMLFKTMKDPRELLPVAVSEYEQLEAQAHQFSLEAVLHHLDCLQECQEKMFRGGNRRVEMEMAAVRLCSPELDSSPAALVRRIQLLEAAVKTGGIPAVRQQAISEPEQPVPAALPTAGQPEERRAPVSEPGHSDELPSSHMTPLDCWPEILSALHETSPSLCSFLDNSVAYLNGKYVLIDAPNSMAFEVLRKSQNQIEKMRDAIARVTGKVYRLGPYKRQEEEQERGQPSDPMMELLEKAEEAGIKTTCYYHEDGRN